MFNGTGSRKQTVFKKEKELYIKHHDFTLLIDDNLRISVEDNKYPDEEMYLYLSINEARELMLYLRSLTSE